MLLGEAILITEAIERGLVIADVDTTTKELDEAEVDNKIMSAREVNYTITAVIHPVTGV